MENESYVYKKEVDWSLFNYGFAIPLSIQVVFRQASGRLLERGESRDIELLLNGKQFKAKLNNNSIDRKFGNHSDIVQIRYTPNSAIANELRHTFPESYLYIRTEKERRSKGDKTVIRLPEDKKEYLAIYTSIRDDIYILEAIRAEEISTLKEVTDHQNERIFEAEFNYDRIDEHSCLREVSRITRIRKLNQKIGESLKLLYGYRCQICGQMIGEEYNSHVVEAHHIDYFVKSLNNDASNQLIVCPNHHSIIHDVNPVFDRKQLIYIYANGYSEPLKLNKHLTVQ